MYRDISLYIVDILIAINKIKRYTSKFANAQEFKWSELEWDATLKELEIVGESIKQLLREEKLDASYRKIVDFRNIIVHSYFGIDEDEVWYVITKKLDELYKDIFSLAKEIDIQEAIESAKIENCQNPKVIAFLNKLQKDLYAT